MNPLLRRTRDFLTALPPGDGPVPVIDALDHQLALLRAADPDVAALLPTRDPDDRHVLAREHYFAGWDEARACARAIDRRFEAAADAIVDGDLATLRRLLGDDPGLARARSAYGHRATLLHHVAANGVEVSRQWQSPANAPDLARALLDAGAEVDATMASYGAADTTMTLLLSSSHPAEAGTQLPLIDVLVAAGADLDRDAGAPLATAIVWGYQDAVDRLVARGARIDNLVVAAGVGDLDRVRALLGAPGPARLGAIALDPTHVRDCALVYAASLGRREIVAFLLAHGADPSFRDPVYGATALGAARYPHPAAGRPHGNPDVVALLTDLTPAPSR